MVLCATSSEVVFSTRHFPATNVSRQHLKKSRYQTCLIDRQAQYAGWNGAQMDMSLLLDGSMTGESLALAGGAWSLLLALKTLTSKNSRMHTCMGYQILNFELVVLTQPLPKNSQVFVIPFAKSATTGQHFLDNTRSAFLQLEDHAIIYRRADQPNISIIINPELDVWQHIKLPCNKLPDMILIVELQWPCGSITFNGVIAMDCIKFCWIHLRGIRVWLNALAIETPATQDQNGIQESVKESVSVPLKFYLLSVLTDKGIVIDAEYEVATQSNLPFVMFRHATSSHLFLYHILQSHLEASQVKEAILLPDVVESGAESDVDSELLNNQEVLATVVEFLDHFDTALERRSRFMLIKTIPWNYVSSVVQSSLEESMASSLLKFKLCTDEILDSAFRKSPDFSDALSDGFLSGFKMRQNKPAEMLGKYLDAHATSALAGPSGNLPGTMLNSTKPFIMNWASVVPTASSAPPTAFVPSSTLAAHSPYPKNATFLLAISLQRPPILICRCFPRPCSWPLQRL
ncbi:hypothetical protein BT96DRAFT_1005611 [Gymnopus androsaceus JB14]|uniref:Uncharacterized protein n=1 Tax=Gymnopus androsaceus JB14 TaxID=1447944 RepID=A0A6A4GNK9_9AGAR|nr:hypothetical protein BT96DRAFT_1005611 [Gymnopus androsaceus JB14]